jgi:hypothetical protein
MTYPDRRSASTSVPYSQTARMISTPATGAVDEGHRSWVFGARTSGTSGWETKGCLAND